jgi:hypothetical protein
MNGIYFTSISGKSKVQFLILYSSLTVIALMQLLVAVLLNEIKSLKVSKKLFSYVTKALFHYI